MDNTGHEFSESLKAGKTAENRLDEYFSRWYNVEPVTIDAEKRQGIDRFFTNQGGVRYSVEYKSDSMAERTGNAFIEVVSNDNTGAPGWALKSTAEILIYFTKPNGFCVSMIDLKRNLFTWQQNYKTASAQNVDRAGRACYRSFGVLVPISEIEKMAFKTFTLTTS